MRQLLSSTFCCEVCESTFQILELSDFAYGELILISSSGEYRYLNALGDPTYQELIDIIMKQPIEQQIEVQRIFGSLTCDYDSNNQPFKIGGYNSNTNYRCPRCMSIEVRNMGVTFQEFISVSSVSHIKWNKLNSQQKEAAYLLMTKELL